MLAMSLRAFGAMMSFISLPAAPGSFCSDLAFDVREKLIDGLPVLQDDALALIDFIEAVFGCLSKRLQVRLPILLPFFEKTQRFADDFAGVAVAPRGDLTFDKGIQMF